MNFEIMFLNKGVFKGKRILSKASVEKMLTAETNQSMIKYTPAAAKGYDYGLGLWIQEKDANGKTTAVSTLDYLALAVCGLLSRLRLHYIYQELTNREECGLCCIKRWWISIFRPYASKVG
jgi:hypothetical protein